MGAVGAVTIESTTVSGNQAVGGAGGNGFGGGIFVDQQNSAFPTVEIEGCVVTGNQADGGSGGQGVGGGLYISAVSSVCLDTFTTVTGNVAGCPNGNWTGVNPQPFPVPITSGTIIITQGGKTIYSQSF